MDNLHYLFFFLIIGFNLSCQSLGFKKKNTSEFLSETNETLKEEAYSTSLASWIHANFITPDTTQMASESGARFSAIATKMALESKKYRGQDKNQERMLELLGRGLTVPAPSDPTKNKELSKLKTELESLYGSGQYCKTKNKCQSLEDLKKVMAKSRKPKKLLEAWKGWRTISVPMKSKYQRSVELGNRGARELGYKNMADLWRSNYDMPPEDFERELDRLWVEVKPLYEQLHCFVRGKLNKKYGRSVVGLNSLIPAHLLGNMWAQSWENISDIVGIKKTPQILQNLSKKPATTQKKWYKQQKISLCLWGCQNSRNPFIKIPCSKNQGTGTWSVTPVPGTWTVKTMFALKCVLKLMKKISEPSTMNWDISTITWPIKIFHSFTRAVPMTASTRLWETPLNFPSPGNILKNPFTQRSHTKNPYPRSVKNGSHQDRLSTFRTDD